MPTVFSLRVSKGPIPRISTGSAVSGLHSTGSSVSAAVVDRKWLLWLPHQSAGREEDPGLMVHSFMDENLEWVTTFLLITGQDGNVCVFVCVEAVGICNSSTWEAEAEGS